MDTERIPQIGDDVLYRMATGRSAGAFRPAKVIVVHDATTVGIRVFCAGILDSGSECDAAGMAYKDYIHKVFRGEGFGQWSWAHRT